MSEKSGAEPKYLICVRTLALVSGIAGGVAVGCSSMETGPGGGGGYTGGPVGVSVYDGGFMGTRPIPDDAGSADSLGYDGGTIGILVTSVDGGQVDADGGAITADGAAIIDHGDTGADGQDQ